MPMISLNSFYSEKMRITWILSLFVSMVTFFPIRRAYGQPPSGNTKFLLTGEIAGRGAGSISLWYSDNANKQVADTIKLENGKFYFSGTVNRACEALLWTDLKNHNFDDPSVIRFLLEPKEIHITYKQRDSLNPIITGSVSESERENWNKVKMPLLNKKRSYYESLFPLARLLKANKNPETEHQVERLGEQIDSINEKIKPLDINYIKLHPNSYLSAYLLSQQKRKLPVDSIEVYFNGLTRSVKQSALGHDVLMYVYPLTDDNAFRKANPLINAEFDDRLSKINSVFDFNFKDSAGNVIAMSSFKAKYLVIDFWASWCKPCIANIPDIKQMAEEYKTDSIQFISISIDKDPNEWKESIRKHDFTGVQLSEPTGFYSLAAIYCKVLWVPTYLVADRNGHIIRYNAPQASEPELKLLLDNLINKGLSKHN